MKFFNLFFALTLCCCFVACSELDDPQDQSELTVDDRNVDLCRVFVQPTPGSPPPNCPGNLDITLVDYVYPTTGGCCAIFEFANPGDYSYCAPGIPITNGWLTVPSVPSISPVPPPLPPNQFEICFADAPFAIAFQDANGDCQAIDLNC